MALPHPTPPDPTRPDAAQLHLTEMVAPPPPGRLFTSPARPGFADCSPSGRMRLDSLARWLQDVAYDDVEECGLQDAAIWVLRRTRIQVRRWPRFGGHFEVLTFCSGLGRMWAERRTSIRRRGATTSDAEAVALWVHLDPEHWRPLPLSEPELAVYGPSAKGRHVSARLRHPHPPDGRLPGSRPGSGTATWTFRTTDLDIAAHVNNAAYWTALEHELLEGPEPSAIDAEIEFRAPAQPGEKLLIADGGPLRAGAMRWIADADGEVHASLLLAGLGE